jgi:transposase
LGKGEQPVDINPFRAESFEIADEVWAKIAPLLPLSRIKIKKGRPRMRDRQAMVAILYKLRTGCSWKALPPAMGAGSTIYDRFQEWQAANVFDKIQHAGILQITHEVPPYDV